MSLKKTLTELIFFVNLLLKVSLGLFLYIEHHMELEYIFMYIYSTVCLWEDAELILVGV